MKQKRKTKIIIPQYLDGTIKFKKHNKIMDFMVLEFNAVEAVLKTRKFVQMPCSVLLDLKLRKPAINQLLEAKVVRIELPAAGQGILYKITVKFDKKGSNFLKKLFK